MGNIQLRSKRALIEAFIEENLSPQEIEKLLNTYVFANRLPRNQENIDSLKFKPKILERKPVIERVADKITAFIDTFVEGMGGA